jgi:hypothetical protein
VGPAFQRRLAGRSGARGFEVFLTADKNIQYQQNLAGRKIAVLVLSTPRWPVVRLHVEKIAVAVNSATTGSFIEIVLPFRA